MLLGLIQDSFDDTIRTSEELEAITGLPELACVPFVAALGGAEDKNLKASRTPLPIQSAFTPIALRDPTSPSAESYQALCSFVLLSSTRKSTKTLVVTSATPGEGKSTVSCNLATALAQRGRKVLLIDADLRCSSIHSQLGIGPGLSAICATDSSSYLRHQPIEHLPNLHAIPAGTRPADPTGVLDSDRMHKLLATWRKEYDHIIIDTPPALPFADAWVLSAQADGVILVARSGMSRSKALMRVQDLLARSGANILGIVLNAARQREYYYEFPAGYRQATKSNVQLSSRQQKPN
jgi:succinoglycan biosynthesis transport protein ExoP